MIDASTFQRQIAGSAETIAQKVGREGIQHLAGPKGFHGDIFISIRQAKNTHNFLYWVHSDDLRSNFGWRDNDSRRSTPL
jgi:hypothetical protein